MQNNKSKKKLMSNLKKSSVNGIEIEIANLDPSLSENLYDVVPSDKTENKNIFNNLEFKDLSNIGAALAQGDLCTPCFPSESSADVVSVNDSVDNSNKKETNITEEEKKLESNNRSVFVNNVEYKATPEELKNHFSDWGEILRITIKCNKVTGKPKGHAYIEFENEESTDKAIELCNNSMFMGRQLKVIKKRLNLPGKKRIAKRAAKTAAYGYPAHRGMRMMAPFPFPMHMPYMPYPIRGGFMPRGRGRY